MDATPRPEPDKSFFRSIRIDLAVVAVVPFLVYAVSLPYGFVYYDDHIYYLLNPGLAGGEFRGLAHVFDRYYYDCFPLTQLSLWLDLRLGAAEHLWIARVQQLTWVAVAALGVRALVWRLTQRPGLALWVAVVFAIHPVAVQTAVFLANRKTILSLALALWCVERYSAYRQGGEKRWLALSFALCVLSMLSKAQGVAIPGMLVAYEVVFRPGRVRTAVLSLLPFVIWTGKYLYLTLVLHPRTDLTTSYLGGSWLGSVASTGLIAWRYLGLTVFPAQLSFYYDVRDVPADSAIGWLAWLALFALMAAAVWRSSDRRVAAFGWLFGMAAMAPTLNLVRQVHHMWDHYLHWGLAGWLLALALLVDAFFARLAFPRITRTLALSAAAVCATLTLVRMPVFGSGLELAREATQRQPGSSLAWANYAIALHETGGAAMAQATGMAALTALRCHDALRLGPRNTGFLLKEAVIFLVRSGQPKLAAELERRTLEGREPDAEIAAGLAEANVRLGLHARALEIVKPFETQWREAAQHVASGCRAGQAPDALPPALTLEDLAADPYHRQEWARVLANTIRIAALARLQSGDPEGAFAPACLLVNLRPHDRGARLVLAATYRKLGNEDAAREQELLLTPHVLE